MTRIDGKARWADARILIIDDVESNVRLLARLLARAGYRHVATTTDARNAIEAYRVEQPHLVLMDLRMPHVDGFALLQQMHDLAPSDEVVPVLVITADAAPESRLRANLLGAADYLIKPYLLEEVVLRVDALLELRAHAQQGFRAIAELQQAVQGGFTSWANDTQEVALRRLTEASAHWDSMTEGHPDRVGELTADLAAELGLPIEMIDALRQVAPLHDIGKSAIPVEILEKPGALTAEEMAVAQRHAAIGALILSGSPFPLFRLAAEVAVSHHERWDGTGYPRRLSGTNIPLVGRIVAVADVFDALTHRRAYKSAWTAEQALEEIIAQRKKHFDPRVVDALIGVLGRRTPASIPTVQAA
jgi:putative two-component system response regulator